MSGRIEGGSFTAQQAAYCLSIATLLTSTILGRVRPDIQITLEEKTQLFAYTAALKPAWFEETWNTDSAYWQLLIMPHTDFW